MRNVTGQVDLTRTKPASISRVTRIVAGRVGSGQEHFKTSRVGSGRVGSGGFQNLAGRVVSGQEVFRISRVGSGRVRSFSKSRGSGRVGSRRLEILAGRVGSGQDVSKFSRVGSSQLTRPEPTRSARFDPTREKPRKKRPFIHARVADR